MSRVRTYTLGFNVEKGNTLLTKIRHRQDSNLRGQSPADFESASLTSRTRCQHTFQMCQSRITFEFWKTQKVQYDFNLHILTSASMAQLVERSAVNRQVLGSIPSGGVFFSILFSLLPCNNIFVCLYPHYFYCYAYCYSYCYHSFKARKLKIGIMKHCGVRTHNSEINNNAWDR